MSTNGPSAAGATAAPVYGQLTPTALSWYIMGRYWQLLHERPTQLTQLYHQSAHLSRSEGGLTPTQAQGRDIAQYYAAHAEGMYVYVKSIDSVPTGPQQVLTQVVGEIALPSVQGGMLPFRPFTQSLILGSVAPPSEPIDTPCIITIFSDILRLEPEEPVPPASVANGTCSIAAEAAQKVRTDQGPTLAPSLPNGMASGAYKSASSAAPATAAGTVAQTASATTNKQSTPTASGTLASSTYAPTPAVATGKHDAPPPPREASAAVISAPDASASTRSSTQPNVEQALKPTPAAKTLEATPVSAPGASVPTAPAPAPSIPAPALTPAPSSASSVPSAPVAKASAPAPVPTPAPVAPAPVSSAPKPPSWANLAAKRKTESHGDTKSVAAASSGATSAPTARRLSTTSATSSAMDKSEGGNKSAQGTSKGQEASVFIRIVPEHIKKPALTQALSQFGPVLNVHLVSNRPCAFVDFGSVEAARRALEASAAQGGIKVTNAPGQPKVVVESKRRWNQDAPKTNKPRASGKGRATDKGDNEGFQAVKGRRGWS